MSKNSDLAVDGGRPVIGEPLPSIKNSSGRTIGEEERTLGREVSEAGTLAYIYGSKARAFEEAFAALMGARHAAAVSSGTAALHTAMIYRDPEPGDEVLVSPITDMGTVIPILLQQAVPVFVDVDPDTQNMDPTRIEEQISARTRAIIVTHIYGSPADMDPIMDIARRHELFVVEDCAQAHLAEYRGRRVGVIGDMGCYSLQQSKHITTGDGGVVICNEDKRYGRELRLCFDKGWPRQKPVREHYFLAPNYHMTELQAAVALAQIKKYPRSLGGRCAMASLLDDLLKEEPRLQPVRSLAGCRNVYFSYAIRLRVEQLRVDVAAIVDALQAEGLPCELGYPGPVPLYLYEMMKERKTFGSSGWPLTSPAARKQWSYPEGLCPQAEKACRETVVLPWNEGLKERHVRLIAEALFKVVRAYAA